MRAPYAAAGVEDGRGRDRRSKRYDMMDEELKAAQDNVDMEEKRALLDEYAAWRTKKLAQLEAERPAYLRLTAHLQMPEDEDKSFQEEVRPLPATFDHAGAIQFRERSACITRTDLVGYTSGR